MHVTGRLMMASVGSTIVGSARSSNRMSRAPYNTAPCMSHLCFVRRFSDSLSLSRPLAGFLVERVGSLGGPLFKDGFRHRKRREDVRPSGIERELSQGLGCFRLRESRIHRAIQVVTGALEHAMMNNTIVILVIRMTSLTSLLLRATHDKTRSSALVLFIAD